MSLADQIQALEMQQQELEAEDSRLKTEIARAEDALLNGDPEPRRLISYIGDLQNDRVHASYSLGQNDARLIDMRNMQQKIERGGNESAAERWHDDKETVGAARVPDAVVQKSSQWWRQEERPQSAATQADGRKPAREWWRDPAVAKERHEDQRERDR